MYVPVPLLSPALPSAYKGPPRDQQWVEGSTSEVVDPSRNEAHSVDTVPAERWVRVQSVTERHRYTQVGYGVSCANA